MGTRRVDIASEVRLEPFAVSFEKRTHQRSSKYCNGEDFSGEA